MRHLRRDTPLRRTSRIFGKFCPATFGECQKPCHSEGYRTVREDAHSQKGSEPPAPVTSANLNQLADASHSRECKNHPVSNHDSQRAPTNRKARIAPDCLSAVALPHRLRTGELRDTAKGSRECGKPSPRLKLIRLSCAETLATSRAKPRRFGIRSARARQVRSVKQRSTSHRTCRPAL
jgi:hypothetical protein